MTAEHPRAPERLAISTDITRQDWIGFNTDMLRADPAFTRVRPSRAYIRFLLVLLAAPIVVLLITWRLSSSGSTSGLAFMEILPIVAIVIALVAFAILRMPDAARTFHKHLAAIEHYDYSAYCGPVSVAIERTGVEIVTPSRTLKLSWPVVVPSETPNFLAFTFSAQDAVIIPKTAFPSVDAAAAFHLKAHAWWHAGQTPEPQRLAAYLAERDAPCPSCRYNLRGCQAQKCPECGTPLRLATFVPGS